ncbi:MAG: hypothetical protein J9259_07910 [Thermoplasmata archaeon YP2-bin.285]|uniref:Uncharacterized protein n=1 Tax=Candidatus Sysuiplasma superficiale TaxID=2823368 RepID=A0A8J7YPE1_9ARCH|nr:hypothetical protein [Candidatus Sysuiplasma superficiale]
MKILLTLVMVVAVVAGVAAGYFYSAGAPNSSHAQPASLTLVKRGAEFTFMGYKSFSFNVPYGNFTVIGNGSWIVTNRAAEFNTPDGLFMEWEAPPSHLPAPSFYNVTTYPWIWKYEGVINYTVFTYPQKHLEIISFVFYSPVSTTLKFLQPFAIAYHVN